ncbi:hypothetical protein HMPREF1991_00735 [Hoylesella loescheii DSM 19665 = JCM 12249 = ATCC 15930]|uniref:Uncharacterized protein n=1 Tax=Hoylesella loescheii DSM 19665 = JCM 12249 = ATCC 15930 TaxID=1122985 RepID=A0A069QMG2_HOYLO|nr:hypothetical protein HMPREF1991_00735 [Hoylesella loescheii DSM 19665 = JCM 12249 = ATCC 15930]
MFVRILVQTNSKQVDKSAHLWWAENGISGFIVIFVLVKNRLAS